MLILFGGLFACLAIGVPVFAALGVAGAFAMMDYGIELFSIPQTIFDALDSFTLMAIPFFILAGSLMQTGGISRRLINLANALVGWLRGGLGASSILTCMFFATMSGSSSATTAAVGTSMIPAMENKGYPKNFAAACVAVGGELGAIIPPSLVMIVYGLIANVSIGSMFIAGILPGVLVGVSLMMTIIIVASIVGFDVAERVEWSTWAVTTLRALKESFLSLLMPLIILGGIYSGAFTATEASVVAVLYALFLGGIVYRELTWHSIRDALKQASIMTAVIMLIIGFAGLFAYMLTLNQIPQKFGMIVSELVDGPIGFLLLSNLLLFVSGMFMEAIALIVILVPILAPIAIDYGINPIHFGIVMIVNICIGMITPPVGVNLFIACQIANLSVESLLRPLGIFLCVLILDVLLISYIPWLSLAFL
ncbi:TRAP transporter large permease [Castellaniella sp. S9]|uniref:TRAP transporter large permease n=1 Tax=Castellaniella sp. S9 TaxID=2993652 RepID=UPI0022B2BD3C|nr:TRAP transporter large permease [Castellaniella sp. S9]